MKRMILTMVTAGLIVGVTGIGFADEPEGRIQQRKENQQARIGNGVKNGTLSPRETVNLEKKEGALNHEIHHDRVQNGGNLTNKEKAQVNRQQNRLSRQIYRDKHDGPGK
ncbi:MAG TPA: hypothetical protein VGP62_28415 [Bryobacteraceae bacterium]|jgi:hypothetical protein|nr:hypothetical protein [Bryobacteraceae bacterium]